MGRLEKMIPNKRLLFKVHNLQKFDYKMLMNNPNTEIRQDIVDVYEKLEKSHYYLTNKIDSKYKNIDYVFSNIKEQILELGVSEVETCDVLVEYLFGKKSSKYKNVLWYCFGEVINQNLKHNLTKKYGEKSKPCIICGERIEIKGKTDMYCEDCARIRKNEQMKRIMRKRRYNS